MLLFSPIVISHHSYYSKKFARNSIIKNNIISKHYALIVTGIQKYPPDVQQLIIQNYVPAFHSSMNIYYDKLGEIILYVPKS